MSELQLTSGPRSEELFTRRVPSLTPVIDDGVTRVRNAFETESAPLGEQLPG